MASGGRSMHFHYDRPQCQNLRRVLRREWLETNGLGDYASSSLICCNTRKYHGLFVAELARPAGRHVLLSTLEESLHMAGREFFISCRKHPGVYHPRGHEYLQETRIGPWPRHRYRFGDVFLTREIMLLPGRHVLAVRYLAECHSPDAPPLTLRIKPLLACRNMHTLRHECRYADMRSSATRLGASVRPNPDLPKLFLQAEGKGSYTAAPDWYRAIEYLVEQERGFEWREDLIMPGVFDVAMTPGEAVYFTASLENLQQERGHSNVSLLWDQAARLREEEDRRVTSLQRHLAREGGRFLIRRHTDGASPALSPEASDIERRYGGTPDAVVAGYHWFGAWGRDTLIALPGLTFHAGRRHDGEGILARMGQTVRDGLIPNLLLPDGNNAYNSVDASLWYIWAVQMLLHASPESLPFVLQYCWPAIRQIVEAYGQGRVPFLSVDVEGFLNVGDENTQLTWMDAAVNGRPVTPRNGQPVEISALWYNALAFADWLAHKTDAPNWHDSETMRRRMRVVFTHRYWVRDVRGDYLADVWRDGEKDARVRPNQLFAVSLPYPVLEEDRYAAVVSRVRQCLLTPYGLRTLAPSAPDYHSLYEGGPAERDGAYHQGTVWAWLVGAYGDALLRAAWDERAAADALLQTLTPLFTRHLAEAGLGSISEIFDGDPPHRPDGCIAQAWSVAESLRLLRTLEQAAPDIYARWETGLRQGVC